MSLPRVALFADSFHEINGAAHTCRQFEAFALRRRQGFLSVRCGPEEFACTQGPLVRGVSHKPVFPMSRGVDTTLFCPERRNRTSGPFRLGFVGRLCPEKNVRFLEQLERGLVKAGAGPFRVVLVGDGGERNWLARHVKRAVLIGVLTGPTLAREYANMDLLVFPSRTDTFGNVVLEAMASGVPAVVTDRGGAKFLVEDGVSGRVAATSEQFIRAVVDLMSDPRMHHRMRLAARVRAQQFTWDDVFEQQVCRAYEACMSGGARIDHMPQLGRLVPVEE